MSADENAADAGAHATDSARARTFFLRAAVTIIALAAYQLSGASSHLLSGLDARFNGSWFPVHAIYLLVSLFGLGALLLPFNIYEDFILDALETGEETDFEEWTLEILKVLAIDLLVGTTFCLALYGLMEWLPRMWWPVAGLLYGIFNTALTLFPTLRGPPEDELADPGDPALRERFSAILKKSGLPELEVLRWTGEESGHHSLLAIPGIGRRRRVIISDELLRRLTIDEMAALLAHDAAHIRNLDTLRMNIAGHLGAILGFAATHAVTQALAPVLGYTSIGDLASFPVVIGMIIAISVVGLPLLNALSRHQEYVADIIAARIAGEDHLRAALEKMNDGGPAAAPGRLREILFDAIPSLHERLWWLNNRRS